MGKFEICAGRAWPKHTPVPRVPPRLGWCGAACSATAAGLRAIARPGDPIFWQDANNLIRHPWCLLFRFGWLSWWSLSTCSHAVAPVGCAFHQDPNAKIVPLQRPAIGYCDIIVRSYSPEAIVFDEACRIVPASVVPLQKVCPVGVLGRHFRIHVLRYMYSKGLLGATVVQT